MGSIYNLYPQFNTKPDRRIQNTPVEFERRSGMDRRSSIRLDARLNNDLAGLKNTFNPFTDNNKLLDEINKDSNKHKRNTLFAAFSPVAPVRRISAIPDNIEQGNYSKAIGLGTLALINIPEDGMDILSGLKQIINGFLGEKTINKIKEKYPKFYKNFIELSKYDYKNYQTKFSFIRGTCLQPLINKLGKFGAWLHEIDKPVFDTKLGKKLQQGLNITITDVIQTKRTVPKLTKEINGEIVLKQAPVMAYKLEGKFIPKLIGRAMLRMPVISLFVLALLEIPAIHKAFSKKNKPADKLKDRTKQITKSAINVAILPSCIGIFGALLSKGGPAYSLLGMGAGSVAGNSASKQTAKTIDKI